MVTENDALGVILSVLTVAGLQSRIAAGWDFWDIRRQVASHMARKT